jgi:arylsulfatase A-like enzyme
MKSKKLLTALLGLLAASASGAEPERPNVLFIAVDDLRNWLGCYGDVQAKTPNIDRLAARGVRFDRAYCGAPLCNPTRTSLITGMRPAVTGVYQNNVRWSAAVPDAMTIPLLFKENGYYVSGAGKITHASTVRASDWHDFGPVQDQDEGGEDVGNNTTARAARKGDTKIGRFSWHVVANEHEGDLIDHRITSYIVERLGQAHDKPFFLACGIHRPHTPWNVPQKYFDLYPLDEIKQPRINPDDLDDVSPVGRRMAHPENDAAIRREPQGPERVIQAYLAATSFCDAQIGRLLEALDRSPSRDNTIIVFWGDHGWHHGEKQHWAKQVLWEEATRAPLLWVAPGVSQPGGVCTRTVDFLSIFPTLCDLAGIPIPSQCKDPSIRTLLADPASAWDRPAMSTMGRGNHAVRDDRWRYIRYADGSEELYDRQADPLEWTNLAGKPELAEIKARMATWMPTEDAPDKGKGGPNENARPPRAKKRGRNATPPSDPAQAPQPAE